MSEFRRSGSAEPEDPEDVTPGDVDRGSEESQVAAETAIEELDRRSRECGGGSYPFDVASQYVQVRDEPRESLYVFLLLLTVFGKDAGPRGQSGAVLLEDVATDAARAYFGGHEQGVRALRFGFPRRRNARSFEAGIKELCTELGEGIDLMRRPNAGDQKDAALDVVIWRPFPDARGGQFIAMGQCATGANWRSKLTELQPDAFCRTWMRDAPAVLPYRLFFTCHAARRQSWLSDSALAGLIFDRCRIASWSAAISEEVRERYQLWTANVLDNRVGL